MIPNRNRPNRQKTVRSGKCRSEIGHPAFPGAPAGRPWARSVAGWAGAGCVSLAVAAAPAPVSAQQLIEDVPESILESMQPVGVQLGAFELRPQIRAEVQYDSNIYNRDELELEDTVFVLRPDLRISPNIGRHELALDLDAQIRRYADITEENSEEYGAALSTTLDLADRTALRGSAAIARRIERRGTFEGQFLSDEPVSYTHRQIGAGFSRTGGTLELSAAIEAEEQDYHDVLVGGAPIDLSARDSARLRAEIRPAYRVSPRLRLFAMARANRLTYENDGAVDRASTGGSILAGTRIEITDLLDAEAAVGYAFQNFDEEGRDDFGGIDYSVRATWTPTPRARLTADAGRSVERSRLQGSDASIRQAVAARLTYVLGSRLLTNIAAEFEHEDYRGIDLTERRFTVGGDLGYRLTNVIEAFAGASYRTRSSSGIFERDYDGVIVRGGLRLVI